MVALRRESWHECCWRPRGDGRGGGRAQAYAKVWGDGVHTVTAPASAGLDHLASRGEGCPSPTVMGPRKKNTYSAEPDVMVPYGVNYICNL